MDKVFKRNALFSVLLILITVIVSNPQLTFATSASEIDRDATAALETLYQQNPELKKLAKAAKGVLIFPKIVKAGLIIGGEGGDGVLRKGEASRLDIIVQPRLHTAYKPESKHLATFYFSWTTRH